MADEPQYGYPRINTPPNTDHVNVPLTAADGTVIGRAKVYSDGRVQMYVGPERSQIWRGLFLSDLAVSIRIDPEIIPARRREFDTRPLYKNQREETPVIDDSAYTFMEKARKIVRQYIKDRLDKSDPPVEFTVYVVWFSKTLENWKALVSSTLPDGMYYEVTYDGARKQTYVDAYKKIENVKVADEEFEQFPDDSVGKARGSDQLLG